MTKRVICVLLILPLFLLPAAADTVTLYNNIDDSNSTCNLLIDA